MKDKFNTILSSFGYGSVSMDDIDQAAQSCSDLCDQFAVEFAEWCCKNGFVFDGYEWTQDRIRYVDQKQLLQLFKNRSNEK